VRYYPREFVERDDGDDDGKEKTPSSKKATIGPWRKRIASWMYDVVDHFQYDRNVVSVALRYIDQYVAHLLVEGGRSASSSSSGGGGGSSQQQPVKRRHFQLIAVTSLYLAIKVHGELMEDDPVSGAGYDVVASLVHEVDGRSFLGRPLDDDDDKIDEGGDDSSGQESDDELRAVSNKLSDLKRRHRKGRWSSRLGQFGLPLSVHPSAGSQSSSSSNNSSAPAPPRQPKRAHSALPYKPRKRGMLSGPLRLHSFVELSRGLFAARDITETERRILVALDYVVNPPTGRKFVGELLRLLALCFRGDDDDAADAADAERLLGSDRGSILRRVLDGAKAQIEGAASVPSLSIGCLPSVVAYGAVLNAVEEEFERLAAAATRTADDVNSMEMEKTDAASSPQLEDFQRHYRRYSRNQSPEPAASAPAPRDPGGDREVFLEAWKGRFLATVFHATNCFLSPDSQDILGVREMLLDGANEGATATSTASMAASPTDGSEGVPTKKRSPRSPRSVVIGGGVASRMSSPRGNGSFFRQGSSSGSNVARLLSPYDSRGRSVASASSSVVGAGTCDAVSFRSLSQSAAAAAAAVGAHHRPYYKQASEPIPEATLGDAGRFARAQTPDVSHFRNRDASRQRMVGGTDRDGSSWRSNSEAFQPPNPNPPFFSA